MFVHPKHPEFFGIFVDFFNQHSRKVIRFGTHCTKQDTDTEKNTAYALPLEKQFQAHFKNILKASLTCYRKALIGDEIHIQ